MDFEYQALESSMLRAPAEVQYALTSPETVMTIQEISKKYGVRLDQESVLFDKITHILLGLEKGSDFVRALVSDVGLNEKTAKLVANEINTSIFERVKNEMRKTQEMLAAKEEIENLNTRQDEVTISSLERVGGFSIDKPATEPERKPVTPADRNSILAGLENPPTSAPTPTDQVPANLPTSSTNSSNPVPRTLPAQPKQEESHVEPLVDYLLSNPVGQASKTVSPTRPTPAQQPKPRPAGTPDPYRESF